jgi:ABC-type phosphate transport system permease subunit
MDAPKRTSRRKSPRFKYLLFAIVVIIVIALLAIIIPLVVLQKERLAKGLKSNVLVPLYIYPAANAWNPLYDA